jgi:hypothetical protein
MASTDTTLLEWVKTVSDLSESLETATGVAVTPDAKKHLLLSGLLPEFKLKKQMIQSQDRGNTLTLADCVDDLTDYAKEENLMNIKKGTSQRRTQTYYSQHDERKTNDQSRNMQSKNVPQKKGGFRERLALQQCKHWTAGTCVHGVNCYRRHEGPGGCAAKAPTTKTPEHKHTSILPTPSAPLLICQYCSANGHALRECPQFLSVREDSRETFFASAKPNYSFPVIEEEFPENEFPQSSSVPLKVLFFALLVSICTYLSDFALESRRALKSIVSWQAVVFFLALAALTSYALAAPPPFRSRCFILQQWGPRECFEGSAMGG